MTESVATGLFDEAEIALSRVGAYLTACGVRLDDELSLQVVALLHEGLKFHPDQLSDWMISEARCRFVATQADLPPATPPLLRGHIGYGRY